MKIEWWFVPILILVTSGVMTLTSPSNVYMVFPLLFGVVSFIGYVMKRFFILDTGIFLMVISYLFSRASAAPPVTLFNLLGIMLFFFLSIGLWFYARNILLISGTHRVGIEGSYIGLSTFRKASLIEILNTLLLAVLLSIIASFIAFYSSIGISMGSMLETLVMVVLSATVFLITFLIIRLFSSEKIKIKD